MLFKQSILMGASEERLSKLIHERLKPGADKEKIDKRIWDLFGEDWCVMYTDLSGFSRGAGQFGIIHFLQIIHESERIFIPIIEDNDGILLKMEGDSMMVIFRNPKKALKSAIEMQRISKIYNTDRSDNEQILVCIGLGYGTILKIGDIDVFGSEVNATSKLGEDIADPWEILVTENFMENTKDYPDITFSDIDRIPSGARKAYKVNYKI